MMLPAVDTAALERVFDTISFICGCIALFLNLFLPGGRGETANKQESRRNKTSQPRLYNTIYKTPYF
jgi:hypothetical protein